MKALQLCLASATQQFLVRIDNTLLASQPRALMAAVALAMGSIVAPAPVNAQVWAGQAPSQEGSSVFPQRSAGRWGEMLGGSVGKAIGASVGQPNSGVGRVVGGIAEEIGRNVGRRTAEQPYITSKQQGVGSPQQLPDGRLSRTPYSVPISTTPPLSGAARAALTHHQDNLDLLGARAILASNALAVALATDDINTPAISAHSTNAMTAFEIGLRSAADQGFNVQPWMEARSALRQPPGSFSETELARLAAPMVFRLERSSGPSSKALQDQRTLTDRGQSYSQSQTATIRSIPIEQYGR